ncbi:hypothetical protein ACFWJM_05620 [Streptomyces sp. NPDC127077]|uniref:hypothetical protein n=1 Tax=Streptomyces sp. NPDC127077 TaxID=3347131 RepID=UPI00365CD393
MSRTDRRGYQLELRLQTRSLREHPVVTDLLTAAHGEVNVEVSGRITALSTAANPHQSRRRPLRVGCSVGHGLVGAGTLGCFLQFPKQKGAIGVLSNNHVLAATNLGSIGDPIYQPGLLDSGRDEDRIGTLSHMVPLKEHNLNQLDVAAAVLDPEIEVLGNRLPDGDIKKVRNPSFEDKFLAKIGRTTGRTQGELSVTELDGLQVDYPIGSNEFRSFRFSNVIEIIGTKHSFSAVGDSGSMVYSPRTRIGYAMIFAGSETGVSYAIPLPAALDAMEAEPLDGTVER